MPYVRNNEICRIVRGHSLGGFSKGIAQAYRHKYESANPDSSNSISRGLGSTNEGRRDVLPTDSTAFRRNAECIGFSEISPLPIGILRYHYPNVRQLGSATDIDCDTLPDFDLLCGGFPCQSWSIAGKRQGFDDARGTLFFEIARILSHKRPRHFLLENVKGLLSADGGQAFAEILRILTELDYRVETVVLNSKDYGVPQNRERVFFIGHLGDECRREILSFGDNGEELIERQRNISYAIDANYAKGNGDLNGRRTIVNSSTGDKVKDRHQLQEITQHQHQGNRSYDSLGLAATQSSVGGGRGAKTGLYAVTERRTDAARQIRREYQATGRDYSPRRGKELVLRGDDMGNTLTTTQTVEQLVAHSVRVGGRGSYGKKQNWDCYDVGLRVRRLIPIECARLQGFADDHCRYGRFQNKQGEWHTREISDSGQYKCYGNAVTTNVIQAIITEMLDKGCLDGNP